MLDIRKVGVGAITKSPGDGKSKTAAVKHYDLERGGRFSLYYLYYLTGAIYRENGLDTGGHNADGTRRFDPSIAGDTVRIDANTDERVEKPGTLAEVLSSESVEHASMDTIAAADERIFYAQLHDTLEALIEKLPNGSRRYGYDGACFGTKGKIFEGGESEVLCSHI